MRVRVDDDLCAGHGVGFAICADVFTMDDDEGFARAISSEVPQTQHALVLEASRCCPNGAISVDGAESQSSPEDLC